MIISVTQYQAIEAFGRHDLADVLLGLNRVCRDCYNNRLVCDIPVIKNASDKRFFFWAAGEAARLAIRWCRAPAFDRRGNDVRCCPWEDLQHLISLAMELLSTDRLVGTVEGRKNVGSGDLEDSLIRVVEPQYLLQRQSPYRMAQAILMYQEAATRRQRRDPRFDLAKHDAFMQRTLGCRVESFVLAARQIEGKSCGDHAPLTTENLTPINKRKYDSTNFYVLHGSGLITPAVSAVMERLSGTPNEMATWMFEQHGPDLSRDHDRAWLEGPNPLHRFPVVRPLRDKPDHCLAPIPHLITEWLYEPLAAYLYEIADLPTRKRLDAVFEEYVGMLLEICSPDGAAWVHESDVLPEDGSKVIDWVREFDDTVVLVDAKRAFVNIGAKYRSMRSDWGTVFERNWAKAVVQATSFWDAVQRDKVKALQHCKAKRPLLLIVSFSDGDWRAGKPDLATTLGPYLPSDKAYIPFTVVSIHRLERVVSTWETRATAWLPGFLDDALQRGATVAANAATPAEGGRLTKVFSDIFSRLVEHVTPREQGGDVQQ